jgi:ABC-2 type transport system ATP-binding protein
MDVTRSIRGPGRAPGGAAPNTQAAPDPVMERGAAVIEAHGLIKRYGTTTAVDGLDLTVRTQEIFALLGPNGAGKTTTLEMLEGYRRPDGGTVTVFGQDPVRGGLEWRARIGLVLQTSKLPEELTVTELVGRYAGYYPHPRDVGETIDLVGLTNKRKARAGQLSGGQQRRLDVAIALVGDPDLVFLDEPTTGFDPAARRQAWSMVEDLRTLGKTVLLTTHYMDEAEELADRLAVIVAGTVVAEGTPETVGGRDTAPVRLSFLHPPLDDGDRLRLSAVGDLARDGDRVVLTAPEAGRAVGELVDWSRDTGIALTGLEIRKPSLEDVYLTLATGRTR